MARYAVLIVGAGHAGAQAGISLRQLGFEGSVAMIGDEKEPPYERPPLSREYFAGDKSFDRILIRPAAFWDERGIDMLLGRRVKSVDPVGKFVTAGEEEIGYGKLIWATGGTPRMLTCNGADAANVHAVRRRDDVDAMMAKIGSAVLDPVSAKTWRVQAKRYASAIRPEHVDAFATLCRAKRMPRVFIHTGRTGHRAERSSNVMHILRSYRASGCLP